MADDVTMVDYVPHIMTQSKISRKPNVYKLCRHQNVYAQRCIQVFLPPLIVVVWTQNINFYPLAEKRLLGFHCENGTFKFIWHSVDS